MNTDIIINAIEKAGYFYDDINSYDDYPNTLCAVNDSDGDSAAYYRSAE